MTRTYSGPLPTGPAPQRLNQPEGGLVDNWELLLDEGFEGSFPAPDCLVSDQSSDGEDRYWGADDYRPFTGTQAGWPAAAGADSVDPASTSYPADLDTWLICGPYDLSQAEKFMVEFNLWLEIGDTADDGLFYGISTDGVLFTGSNWVGQHDWIFYREHVQGVAGQSQVWVGWSFYSDGDVFNFDEGAWIDDLKVWRYNTPAAVCGDLDPGSKGMVLNPYEDIGSDVLPIIRAGDTVAVTALANADVKWVRLELIQQGGSVRLQEYDRMIDTLCAYGISVLGLLNHDTLLRQDFDDQASAADYRAEFATAASFYTSYLADRVTYWEVWNEPNLDPDSGNPPFINPIRYAPLLTETYDAIKAANPQAQVLFGGLASAWDDVSQYFTDVYNNLGGSRPFDIFAIHPYNNGRVENGGYGVDPQVYLRVEPDSDTILDKFAKTMSDNLDGDKKIWVTEIGWNSSLDSPNRPWCKIDLTTEQEQADFLKPAFDILFTEVHHWQTNEDMVDKIIWYQYMDVGVDIDQVCSFTEIIPAGGTGQVSGYALSQPVGGAPTDWWWGIYRGDKVSKKLVWCPYFAYPLTCEEVLSQRAYLPFVIIPEE